MSTIETGTRRDPETLTVQELRAVLVGGMTLLDHPDTVVDERLNAKSRDITDWYRERGQNHGDQVVASIPQFYLDFRFGNLLALDRLEDFPSLPPQPDGWQGSLLRFNLGRSLAHCNIAELKVRQGLLQADIHGSEAMGDRTHLVTKEKLAVMLEPIIDLGRRSLVQSIGDFE